jgi:hypothetical protein
MSEIRGLPSQGVSGRHPWSRSSGYGSGYALAAGGARPTWHRDRVFYLLAPRLDPLKIPGSQLRLACGAGRLAGQSPRL